MILSCCNKESGPDFGLGGGGGGQIGPSPGFFSITQKPLYQSTPEFCDFNHTNISYL